MRKSKERISMFVYIYVVLCSLFFYSNVSGVFLGKKFGKLNAATFEAQMLRWSIVLFIKTLRASSVSAFS
jgi:hypothetical protein